MTFTRVLPFIPILYNAYRFFSRAKKTSNILNPSSELSSSLKSHQLESSQRVEIDYLDDTAKIEILNESSPAVDTSINIATTEPTTMPEYLAQQNELAREQIAKTNSLIEHIDHKNSLLAQSIELQIKANAISRLQAETISSTLPALILQLHEIAKIPSILSVTSDINVAYREQALTNHEELIQTIGSLELISAVNIPSQSVAIEELTTATAAQTTELAKVATNLNSVSENATVQKTIADYQVTPVAIKNLDGNTVATIKPMEAQAVKNIVNAKNETDEMEFELDDDILDSVFESIVLPSFSKVNRDEHDILSREYVDSGVQ